MAVGRHRRQYGVLYGRKRERDSRGNIHVVPDKSRPYRLRMGVKHVRGNRAEVNGQLTNEVYIIHVDPQLESGEPLPDIGPWTQIEFDGRVWDVVSPPAFKHGRRRTSHWECEVKPHGGSDLRGVAPVG